jgi:hypothetical protein
MWGFILYLFRLPMLYHQTMRSDFEYEAYLLAIPAFLFAVSAGVRCMVLAIAGWKTLDVFDKIVSVLSSMVLVSIFGYFAVHAAINFYHYKVR